MKIRSTHLIYLSILLSCQPSDKEVEKKGSEISNTNAELYLQVLGVAQDAGYPQADCKKECCKAYWVGEEKERYATCLGLVDSKSNNMWLFEATPDIKYQLKALNPNDKYDLSGIFLTHAHMGHYTGLMHLGREVMGADSVPVYTMPKMKSYLTNNGPWSQLVSLNNISLQQLNADSTIELVCEVKVTPFLVPHRDEYSETVGYTIESKSKKILFIPDINKWNIWERSIVEEVRKVDIAFIDATFLKDGEINRSMAEVPHPFIEETMQLFDREDAETKKKIYFIHFNHTNPAMRKSDERESIINAGFNLAKEGSTIEL